MSCLLQEKSEGFLLGRLKKTKSMFSPILKEIEYSSHPNKRGAPNKRGNGKILAKVGIESI